MNELIELDIDKVINMSDKEFFNNIAYIMQVSLVKDLSLYTYLIDKMYEVCERDKEILSEILLKADKDRKLILDKDSLNSKGINSLSFGYKIASSLKNILKDKYMDGEYLSLGCVAEGYMSYKKNWLTKEEYYEMRDMFVPFYLPISVEMLNVSEVINDIKTNIVSNENGLYSFALLKKIGKTVFDNTISLDDIEDALNELNFDEAW